MRARSFACAQDKYFDSPARGRRAAMTLPEVIISFVILMVILGAVSSFYFTSMQAWYRGSRESRAEQKATWAIQRLAPELRQAMSVTPDASPQDRCGIVIRLPAKDWSVSEGAHLNRIAVNGLGQPYLAPGDYVHYYRGDASGNQSVSGDRVWRVVTHADGSAGPRYVVADNVVDNPNDGTGYPKATFIYWPDVTRLKSVEITVTVRETQAHKSSTVTMVGELAMRNL